MPCLIIIFYGFCRLCCSIATYWVLIVGPVPMEEEKKKRKNKKKKNKQTKVIENNAVGVEESASSNQNHPAEIRGSEAHTDDTSGIDDDSNRHDTEGAKVVS